MVSIILIVLFICQLLSFFLIMILNSKLAKFKDLEARQEKIIREMDDAIGVYLMEMKEENNRFIEELTSTKQAHAVKADIQPVVQQQSEIKQSMIQDTIENVGDLLYAQEKPSAESISERIAQSTKQKPFVPIAFATNAYNKQKEQSNTEIASTPEKSSEDDTDSFVEENTSLELAPFEHQVVEMHKAGKTIEEIAKETQKGKTEIELLIKFHG
ncbi:MAG: hypothetical protein ACI33M_01785 [Lysinibacillus sp.]